MRRYTCFLLVLTLLLVVATFVTLLCSHQNFTTIMPGIVLYFAVVTFFEHLFVFRSARKDARTFIKNFLGLTVGTLLLHLIVMVVYMFTHTAQPHEAKLFLITFCICYLAYLVFETVALVIFTRKKQQ